MDVKPVLQAILLADHVYRDGSSGKYIIAGSFNRLFLGNNSAVPKTQTLEPGKIFVMPGQKAGSPFVYLNLTSLHGEALLILRYADLSDDSILLKMEIKLECKDPLQTVELAFPLPPLPTPHDGVYALELLWNEEMLGSHRVTVQKMPEKKEGAE